MPRVNKLKAARGNGGRKLFPAAIRNGQRRLEWAIVNGGEQTQRRGLRPAVSA
jgi:hypothetical protein